MADPAAARRRRLERFSRNGRVFGLAIDHRDSMIAALRRAGVSRLDDAFVADLKCDVIAALAADASVLMVDRLAGHRALLLGAIPTTCCLVMPLESQGYEEIGPGHRTLLMEDFGPAEAARLFAADGCKLLLPFRRDDPAWEWQLQIAEVAIDRCHAEGLPIVLEAVPYRLADESPADYADHVGDLVASAVKAVVPLGPDVLKLPFPAGPGVAVREPVAARAACAAITRLCGDIPWVLLGGLMDSAEVEAQVRIAADAGAIGFLLGRSVWQPALLEGTAERQRALATAVRPTFQRYVAAVAQRQTPR